MSTPFFSSLADTGLEVLDLQSDTAFAGRHLPVRDVAKQMEGMRRMANAFVDSPDTILQELVNAAMELCDADSAGISMEQAEESDDKFYQWVATAGQYARFLNATLPRTPSACGICLERGRPQIFSVSQRFFDIMGIVAPTVTDGMLLPWQVEEMRGTIWIMAHERTMAFDGNDCRVMQVMADFAAVAVRYQRQQAALMKLTAAASAAAMANELAHQINNPLQVLTNVAYLASRDDSGGGSKVLADELSAQIQRLSILVGKLLQLPSEAILPN
jgi:two-component sensor histidine kinase